MKLFSGLLLCSAAVVYTTSPPIFAGFKIRIGDKLLQEVKRFQRTELIYENRKERHFAVANELLPEGVTIKNIHVKEYDEVKSNVTFAAPNHLTYTVDGGSVALEVALKKEEKQGKASVTLSEINVDLSIAFGSSSTNHLAISNDKCEITIGTVSISVDGLSGLEQWAAETQSEIQTALRSLLCSEMQMGLMLASGHIEQHQLHMPLPLVEGVTFDASLTGSPTASSDYLEFGFTGCPLNEGEQVSGCPSNTLADSGDRQHMFYVFASESMVNNLLRVLHDRSFFSNTIDKQSERYAVVKRDVNDMAAGLQLPLVSESTDFSLTMRTVEPPHFDLVQNPPTLSLKLEISFVTNVGEANEQTKIIRLSTKGNYLVSINATIDGEMFPRFSETIKLTDTMIDEIEGIEMLETQREKLTETLQSSVQRVINRKMKKRFEEYDKEKMRKWAGMGKIDNAYIKLGQRTIEMGFDWIPLEIGTFSSLI